MYENLIQDYIRKVTKNMGSNQRTEVAKELEAHILDSADALAAEKNIKVNEIIIREVIMRMGPPDEVAALYPEEKTFSDNIVDILKDLGRFTLIFIIVFTIISIILKIYIIQDLQLNSVTIFIFITIYLILLIIHLIRYRIFLNTKKI